MFRHPFDTVVQRMNFSQIKAQCAAHMAASEEPLAKPTSDIHTEFASQKFGVPEEAVTPAMRKAAKEYLFCRIYGGS